MSGLKNPKRFAFALAGIAQQNLVTFRMLIAMMIADSCLHFYLVIVLILKQCRLDLNMLQVNVIEIYLGTQIKTHLVTQSFITGFLFLFITTTFLVIKKQDSIETIGSLKPITQCLSIVFISLMTFAQIPFLEYIFSTFLSEAYQNNNETTFVFKDGENSDSFKIIVYCLQILNAVLFLGIMYILQKLYIPHIPSLPWAASSTQLHAMKLINKCALVAYHLYITVDKTGETIYLTNIIGVLFALTGFSRIMLIPHYNRTVEWIYRMTDLITACLFFLLAVAEFIAKTEQKLSNTDFRLCLMLAFVSIPCMIGLAVIIDFYRQKSLWQKLEQRELKHEIEMEHALYILLQKLSTALKPQQDRSTLLAFADLLYLIETHYQTCENYQCPCQKKEIIEYFLNRSNVSRLHHVTLFKDEINLINSQLANDFIKQCGAMDSIKSLTQLQMSNISQMVYQGKNNSQKANIDINKLDLKYLNEIECLESQQQMDAAPDAKDNQSPMFDNSELLVKINVPSVRSTFLNQFIEIYFEAARRRFPQSKRIFFQHVSLAMHSCKNRFMVENLLRNKEHSPHDGEDWIERVSSYFNEALILIEIRSYSYNQVQQSNTFQAEENLNDACDFTNWGISYIVEDGSQQRQDGSMSLQNSYSSLEWLQPEQFIKISQLTEQFNDETEKLARTVQYFWKLIQTEQFDVYHTQKSGISMANTIASVFKIFKDIEEISNDGQSGSINGTSDFRVCFTFALLQKYLLNDILQHDLYIAKMNSQREMRRLIRNNMLQASSDGLDEQGFLLAKGSSQRFGDVIVCNQVFKKQMGYSSDDLQHLQIQDFMPSQIKGWHNQFISDFYLSSGATSTMLNNTTCVFMKMKNGYVKPVMMHLKFHYSPYCETIDENSMSFAMFLSFMQEIKLSRSSTHRLKDVMFFLCNDQDGQLMDISESCNRIIKLSNKLVENTSAQDVDINCLKMEDICPTLPPLTTKNRKDNYEMTIDFDMDIIAKLTGSFRVRNRNQFNFTNSSRAVVYQFHEQYGKANNDYEKKGCLIYAIAIAESSALKGYQNVNRDISIREKHVESMSELQRMNFEAVGSLSPDANNSSGSLGIPENENQSQSSTSGPSNGNSTSESIQLKQMQASTEKTASNSLKLITQLIFGVFILLLILSTVNLTLSLDRYSDLQHEVEIVRRSYDVVQQRGKMRILLRNILVAANGYGNTDLSQRQARFNFLIDEFKNTAINFKETQKYLDTNTMGYEAGQRSLTQKTVELRYLDAENNEVKEMATLSFGMNLYVQRFTDMMNWPMEKFQVNITVMNLVPPPKGYRPSEDERLLYFVVMSGMGNIRTEARKTSLLLRVEAESNALDVAQKTQLTIIISIVAIGIVCLVVSPIICRIEERKYMSLRFFLNVEPEHLSLLDEQVQMFLHLAFQEQHKNDEPSEDEQKIDNLELKSLDLISNGDSVSNSILNNSFLSSFQEQTQQKQSQPYEQNHSSQIQTARWAQQFNALKNNYLDKSKREDRIEVEENEQQKQFPFSFNDYGYTVNNKDPEFNETKKQSGNKLPHCPQDFTSANKNKQIVSKFADKTQNQKLRASKKSPKVAQTTIESQNHVTVAKTSFKKGEEASHSPSDSNEEVKKSESDESSNNNEEVRRDTKLLKFRRIAHVILRQKLLASFLIVSISLIFCSYFIAVYFLSVQPFQETPDILGYLDLIFLRDYNLGVSLAFSREMFVFNSSLMSIDNPTMTSADYFLNESMTSESRYRDLRKNLPNVFSSISRYFDEIETNQSCALAYYDEAREDKQSSIDACFSAADGVMREGISTALSIIIRHFFKVNMNFNNALPSQRNLDFLMAGLRDSKSLMYVDLKNKEADRAINALKNKVTIAVSDYYQRLIGQYTTLYSVFVVAMFLLFISFMVFGFTKIRDIMWKTNLTLKIMPLDFVSRESLPELKAFYQY